MADLARTYTIPLRREFNKAANYRKTDKAVKAVREFLQKHMKTKEVRLGKQLNLELWKHGRKNPPSRVKVTVVKKDDIAKAELFGQKYEEAVKAEEIKEEAKGIGKVKELLGGKEEEVPVEEEKKEKVEVKKETKAPEEKQEVSQETKKSQTSEVKASVPTKKEPEVKKASVKEEKAPSKA